MRFLWTPLKVQLWDCQDGHWCGCPALFCTFPFNLKLWNNKHNYSLNIYFPLQLPHPSLNFFFSFPPSRFESFNAIYMAVLGGGFLMFPRYAFIVLSLLYLQDAAESMVLVRFDRAPPAQSRYSSAVFRYSVVTPDGSNACKHNVCSIFCQVCISIILRYQFA